MMKSSSDLSTKSNLVDIIERFENIVNTYPNQLALIYRNIKVTYLELNERVNQLAHFMIDNNFHNSSRDEQSNFQAHIGIIGSNKIEIIITELACLKIGAAYVLIDKDEPIEKISFITNDALVDIVIICDDKIKPLHTTGNRIIPVIPLTDHQAEINTKAKDNPNEIYSNNLNTRHDNLAYYIYTSGSTGQPKGVMQTRSGLLGQMKYYAEGIGLSQHDKILGISPLTHDQGLSNIYSSLLYGCTLCLFDLNNNNFREILTYIVKNQISIYVSVPTVWDQIAGIATKEEMNSIKVVRLGGEETKIKHAKLFQDKCSAQAQFITAYGASECSFIALNIITHQTDLNALDGIIPMGKVLPHIQYQHKIMAQDSSNQSYSLEITSPYMAVGYTNTEEHQLAYHVNSNGRIYYLTGDLVNIKENVLFFEGRESWHEKVLGNRVNLHGIERLIEKLLLIDQNIEGCECVVIAVGEGDEKELMAYITGKYKDKIDKNKLHDKLKQSLDAFAIPKNIQLVSDFPRLSNNKINRREMLTISEEILNSERRSLISNINNINDLLNSMEEIWCNTLNLAPPLPTDISFKELGGDSTLCIATANFINSIINQRVLLLSPDINIRLLEPFDLIYSDLKNIRKIIKRKINDYRTKESNHPCIDNNSIPFALIMPLQSVDYSYGVEINQYPNLYSTFKINVPAMQNLIDHSCDELQITIKLCADMKDLANQITNIVGENNIKQIGFVCPQNEPDSHRFPCVLCFDEINTQWCLFLSDSLGQENADDYASRIQKAMDGISPELRNSIKIYLDPVGRQNDFNSCNIDCIYYLENALKLSNFMQHILILEKSSKDGYPLYFSPAECMQTYQHGRDKCHSEYSFNESESDKKSFSQEVIRQIENNYENVNTLVVDTPGWQSIISIDSNVSDDKIVATITKSSPLAIQKCDRGYMVYWLEQSPDTAPKLSSKLLRQEKIPNNILNNIPKVGDSSIYLYDMIGMMISDTKKHEEPIVLDRKFKEINTKCYRNAEKFYRIAMYGPQLRELKNDLNAYLLELENTKSTRKLTAIFISSSPIQQAEHKQKIIDTIAYLKDLFEITETQTHTHSSTICEEVLFGSQSTTIDPRLTNILVKFIKSLDGDYLINGNIVAIDEKQDLKSIITLLQNAYNSKFNLINQQNKMS